MKKYLLALILVLFLSGGSGAAQKLPDREAQIDDAILRESSEARNDSQWTEQELLAAFDQYAEPGTVVIDCAALEASVCDIVGVVQYTTEDYSGCWFDFIKREGIPRTGGVEAKPVEEKTLTCTGADTVSCTLLKEDGTAFTCSITYYENDVETGFRLVSE